MTERKKRRVSDQNQYFANAQALIERITFLCKEHEIEAKDITLGHDDDDIYLYFYRLETDKEVAERLKNEDAMKGYRRKQFEALKKEFENDGSS